jgi:hypothetical protein
MLISNKTERCRLENVHTYITYVYNICTYRTCAYIARMQMQDYNRTDLDLIDVVVGNGI